MEKEGLQEKLDIQKWMDSEKKGEDTCGEYGYCAYCDKSVEYPCATAYNKAAEKPAKAQPAKEEKKTCAKKECAKKTTKKTCTKAKKTSKK